MPNHNYFNPSYLDTVHLGYRVEKHFFGGAFFILPFIIHINRSSHCEKKSFNCAFIVHNMFIFVYVKQTKTGKYESN